MGSLIRFHVLLNYFQVAVDVTKLTCRGVVMSGGVASVAALDGVAEEVRLLSPLVDALVSERPAPVNPPLISRLVGPVRHFQTIDFLLFAVCESRRTSYSLHGHCRRLWVPLP